jgi:hypothetical protein
VDVAQVGGGGPSRSVRVLVAAAALMALAVPWRAGAQVPTPAGGLPVPTTLPVLDDGVPEAPGGGVTPPTSPTTPPSTTAPVLPATAPGPVPAPTEQPRGTPAPAGSSRRGTSSRPAPAPPVADVAPVVRVLDDTDLPAVARLRRVSVPAAQQFGFPLALGGLVLAFLMVQSRLDARDPKLAAAPVTVDDDLLSFR